MLDTILLAVILVLEVVEVTAMVAAGMGAIKGRGREEPEAGAEEAQRRESRMDEGFENLMRFSVGGRDGFDQIGDE